MNWFCLFRATPTSYGGSQARSPIGAVAAGLCHSHSNTGSELSVTYTTAHGNVGSLTHWARPGIRTCVLTDASQIRFHWATTGTSYFIFCFLGPHLQHMELPWLGVELELQLLACVTAATTLDPSCIFNLHHSSWQCQILNSGSEARIRPASFWILVGFLTCWATTRTPNTLYFKACPLSMALLCTFVRNPMFTNVCVWTFYTLLFV